VSPCPGKHSKLDRGPEDSPALNDIFSFILGSTLAWYKTEAFHWGIFLCGLTAVFFIANGIYLTNEAQDYEGDRLNQGRIGGRGGMGLATTGGTTGAGARDTEARPRPDSRQ